ncbi:DUF6973 domain-containing protein [Nonomuraea sp. KM90]|uniref:DUF6973 domain-containing protein n=1 Tax=Nonomuraea sp. KM90 TaxID=3457428 RepID=UPI003FCDFE8A
MVARELATDAQNLTRKWYGYDKDDDGTWRNAFLHTLWSALMMTVLGERTASLIGNIHETTSDKGGYWSAADEHNNRTGRSFGALFTLNYGEGTIVTAAGMGKFIVERRKYKVEGQPDLSWKCTNGKKMWTC